MDTIALWSPPTLLSPPTQVAPKLPRGGHSLSAQPRDTWHLICDTRHRNSLFCTF